MTAQGQPDMAGAEKLSVAEARALLERARKGLATDAADRAAMGNVPHRYATPAAAGKYLLDKAILREREARAQEKQEDEQRQMTLFDSGLLPETGPEVAQIADDILRGSLFSAGIMRGRRTQNLKNHIVTDKNGLKVSWSGAALDQADLDVVLALFRVLERETQAGTVEHMRLKNGRIVYSRVRFTRRGLLLDMKRRTGGSGRKWLTDVLDRLGGRFILEKDGFRAAGTLIPFHGMDDAGDVLVVDISRSFIKIFKEGVTWLDWGVRRSLSDGFTKWMQGHICTHKPGKLHRRKTKDLMQDSGSHYTRNRDFREKRLRPALQALLDAGVLSDFTIRGDAISFLRPVKKRGKSGCG